jgi:tyrosine-protein kinase Etk/Wzc
MKTKEIDILDILLILAKHKKFIFFTTLIVSVAAVAYVMIVPLYWVSTATILPADSDSNSLAFSGSSLLGLGSSLLGGSLNSSGIDLITIMNSRTFTEDVIKEFNLIEYMEIDDQDSLVVKENALKFFRENIRSIGLNDETGVININIETKDKFLSTDIANYFWQKLEKYNLETRMSKGKQKRIFLEARVNEVKSTIDSLSQKLLTFQKENNVILLQEQTAAIVKQYSNLIFQKNQKEIELEFVENFSASQNPNLNKLILENSILSNKILEMETIKTESKYKYILSLDSIPDKALEYANLRMNLEIQEKIFTFLFPQFEQAKIEEIKDLPTIEIVDKAVPSGLRSSPKRAKFCVIAFVTAFLASCIFSILFYMLSNEANSIKIKSILIELKNSNK